MKVWGGEVLGVLENFEEALPLQNRREQAEEL